MYTECALKFTESLETRIHSLAHSVVKKRSCSDDDSESEFKKKTLNQLKKKGPVHFGIC